MPKRFVSSMKVEESLYIHTYIHIQKGLEGGRGGVQERTERKSDLNLLSYYYIIVHLSVPIYL